MTKTPKVTELKDCQKETLGEKSSGESVEGRGRREENTTVSKNLISKRETAPSGKISRYINVCEAIHQEG